MALKQPGLLPKRLPQFGEWAERRFVGLGVTWRAYRLEPLICRVAFKLRAFLFMFPQQRLDVCIGWEIRRTRRDAVLWVHHNRHFVVVQI